MPTNDFLPFATSTTAPVLSQATYAASTPANGRGPGIVPKEHYNKSIRQGSVVAAAIGTMMSRVAIDARDNGDIAALTDALVDALRKTVLPGNSSDQHLAMPGYQKLVGGLILQWANGSYVTSEGQQTVPLYMPFPTTCLFALISTNSSAASNDANGIFQLVSFNPSSVTVYAQSATSSWGTPVYPTVAAFGF